MYLPHRIRIESRIDTQDDTTGVVTQSWSHFATVWAHFRPSSVREFVEAGAQSAQVIGAFKVRPLAGLLPSMRIVWGDRIYGIEGMLADPKAGTDYLTIAVSEVVSG